MPKWSVHRFSRTIPPLDPPDEGTVLVRTVWRSKIEKADQTELAFDSMQAPTYIVGLPPSLLVKVRERKHFPHRFQVDVTTGGPGFSSALRLLDARWHFGVRRIGFQPAGDVPARPGAIQVSASFRRAMALTLMFREQPDWDVMNGIAAVHAP